MDLVRWKDRPEELAPWSALREFERRMSRLFEDFGGDWTSNGGTWSPAADLKEHDDRYELTVDLPGMKKDEIHLTALENTLTIRGERRHEEEKEVKGTRRIERHYGAFHRSFEFPVGFDANKIKADYHDGVLTVKLPKRPEAKARTIEVSLN